MFGNKIVAKMLQCHVELMNKQEKKVSDIHQSNEWRSLYGVSGYFNGDSRGISLSLCTDGMNPFAKEKCTYSMWPIQIGCLNLPRRTRYKAGSLFLAGIIPGRKEPKNIDPYLDILVDELITINGSKLYDAYRNEDFSLKVKVVLNVFDYPGQNKVFHCQGKYMQSYFLIYFSRIASR